MLVIDNLTQKITYLEVSLKKKDKINEELANIVRNVDIVVKKLAGTIEKMNSQEEEKKRKGKKSLKCSNCSCNSKQGLQIHMKKKHTAVEDNTFPRTCHLYDKQCENSSELKKHVNTFIQGN